MYFKLVALLLIQVYRINSTGSSCTSYSLASSVLSNGDFDNPNLSGANFRQDSPGVIGNWPSSRSKIAKGNTLSSQWGSSQVIELDASSQNLKYNQSMSLGVGKTYLLELQCVARQSQPLSTSGFRVLVNDVVVLDQSNPIDYLKHTYQVKVTATVTASKITLQGMGLADSYGTSCDNAKFKEILIQYFRVEVNGVCQCMPGYYSAGASLPCSSCSTINSQCSGCTSSTICSQCMTGFYLSSTTTCSTCASVLPNCINCTSNGLTCLDCTAGINLAVINGTCQCMTGYFQNSSTQICTACTSIDPLCTACLEASGVASCSACSTGYFASGSSCLTCSSALFGCQQCTSDGSACTQCDSTMFLQVNGSQCGCQSGYGQNSLLQCVACSSIDPLCTVCQDSSGTMICGSCSAGYYTLGTNCLVCNTAIFGCSACNSNGTICTLCDSTLNLIAVSGQCQCMTGYFQNSSTQICTACTSIDPLCTACLEASGVASCSACSTGYFTSGSSCLTCSSALFGCQQCTSDGSACTQCDSTLFLQVNGSQCGCQPGYGQNSLLQCVACSSIDPLCTVCQDSSGTMICDSCSAGHFFNQSSSSCTSCIAMDPSCTLCTNITNHICLNCSAGYFLNPTSSCQLCGNNIPGCTNCTLDGSICYDCNQLQNYFLNASSCTLCTLVQCLNCSSLSTCLSCNEANNYYLNITSNICELCTIEGCLNCSSLTECYQCDLSQNYIFDNVSKLCTLCSLEGCIQCISNQTCYICGEGYNSKPNGNLTCEKSSLKCSDLIQGLPQTIKNPSVPSNYSLDQCEAAKNIDFLARTIAYSSYGILFLSIFSGKIVGLELFGVLQMSYFNLANHNEVNLYLSPFLGWGFTNGFNFHVDDSGKLSKPPQTRVLFLQYNQFVSDRQVVPDRIKKIGYSHSFLENMNIMLLVVIGVFILSLTLMVISIWVPCIKRIAYILFKEVFLTVFLFNCFNIAFSVGLHFKYATPDNTNYYILSTIAAITTCIFCIIIVLSLQLLNNKQYGQYKQKFKRNWLTRAYMSISIIYRIFLGFYMAYGNEQNYQSLLILAVSMTYIMYNIVNLPFSQAYQNYRANFCHCTQLITLLVSNFYTAMKANQPISVKSRIFTPAKLEVVMIVLCLLISSACLLYQICLFIKGKCKGKQVSNRQINTTDQSEQNIGSNIDYKGQHEAIEQ